MTKPSLKEKLEKKYIGRNIKRADGFLDTIKAVRNPENEAFPLIGTKTCFCPHQVRILKPRQKQKRVSYEELARFWDEKIQTQAHGFQRARNSGTFKSLCDLLGVRKP